MFFATTIGAALWWAIGNGKGIGWGRWAVVALVMAITLLPPVTRLIWRSHERINALSPRGRVWTAVGLGAVACVYFIVTAHLQDRDLFPKTHDDQSYLIQMQLLARGQLWGPPHELADFFETFYVSVRPQYASMYFHGAALMYVPTIWLGLPTWLMPTMVAGACVALLYRIVAELLGGSAGLIAAAFLATSNWFRMYSVLLTSHEPMLVLGLLMFWAWMRWRQVSMEGGGKGWILAIGAFAGWAAITRPLDAVCFALPLGIGLLWDLRRSSWKRWAIAGLLLVAGAAPILAVQGVGNYGVTGDVMTSPFRQYLDTSQPGTALGIHRYDPTVRPASKLRQKQDYYDSFYVPFIKEHQPDTFLATWWSKRLPMTVDISLPARALLLLLPLGAIGLAFASRQHRPVLLAMVAVLPLFVGLYLLYAIFLEHYMILILPVAALLLVAAMRVIASTSRGLGRRIAVAVVAGLLALVTTLLPEFNGLWSPEYAISDETFAASGRLRAFVQNAPAIAPAVVLFRYNAGDKLWEEPVYNTDVAWPDDAPVIRAHDLGPRNVEIFRYYAQRDPDRMFYLYDRRDLAVGESPAQPAFRPLGTARELATRAGSP